MGEQAQDGFDPGAEFDRQVQNLLDRGYDDVTGLGPAALVALLSPLRETLLAHADLSAPSAGGSPFVLVVTRALAAIERTMPLTTLPGGTKPGLLDRLYEPGAIERFVPPAEVSLPDEPVYLLFDVDRGEEFCGVVPRDAMATLGQRGRTLLTMEEGIAFVTHHPAVLAKDACFSLGGSRCGDRRVPALWISRRAPKLGWCWEGNPHSWLGMASAGARAA